MSESQPVVATHSSSGGGDITLQCDESSRVVIRRTDHLPVIARLTRTEAHNLADALMTFEYGPPPLHFTLPFAVRTVIEAAIHAGWAVKLERTTPNVNADKHNRHVIRPERITVGGDVIYGDGFNAAHLSTIVAAELA